MNHQMEVEYLGNLRTKATHLQSDSQIITDAPIDNKGKGEAFSPTDLFASSFASCMLTIIGIAAETNKINIKGVRATVKKIMSENPRSISEIYVTITFKTQLSSKSKNIVEKAARHCPVGKSISSKINEVIIFNYLSE